MGLLLPKPKSRALTEKKKALDAEREWRKLRRAVLERDKHYCRAQADTWGHFGTLDVHHIVPRSVASKEPLRRDLVSLCRLHHQLVQSHRLWIRAGELGADGHLEFSEEE